MLAVKPLAYLAGASTLAAIVLAGLLWGASARIDGITAERDAAKTTIEARDTRIGELTLANANAIATSQTLLDDLEALIGERDRIAEALDATSRQLDTARTERQRARAELDRYRSQTYANDPACRDWGDRPVCPAISRSLQDHAAALSAHADPARAGGEAGADSPPPDR